MVIPETFRVLSIPYLQNTKCIPFTNNIAINIKIGKLKQSNRNGRQKQIIHLRINKHFKDKGLNKRERATRKTMVDKAQQI